MATSTHKVVCPHDCPDTCVATVEVEDGRAVKIGGDPDHPFTQGFLCAKLNQYLDRVYSPERILHPLKRVGKKGGGSSNKIQWDEALDTIAANFTRVSAEHSPQSILPYSYAGNSGLIHFGSLDRRFFGTLGASLLDRTICASAGGAGYRAVMGTSIGFDPEALENGCSSLESAVRSWVIVVAKPGIEGRRLGR